jgi:phosphatidylserine decarboxylase
MTLRRRIRDFLARDDVNFLLTNRIPRRALTRFAGWFSRVEQPAIRSLSIALWRFFSDLDLSEADSREFRSLHHCFTRRLIPGARPIDNDSRIVVSPCDAIVGAHGTISGDELHQIKGFRYALGELLGDDALARVHRNGRYATLRLTSSMYHHFHAPYDCRVDQVAYIAGDTFNVNPPTLRRIDKVYCKNERAVLQTTLRGSAHAVTLVPVGAVLVAGIRLNFVDLERCRRERTGDRIVCKADFRKGDEMGWFEHGSTIVILAPDEFALCENVAEGVVIRVGQPLMRLP